MRFKSFLEPWHNITIKEFYSCKMCKRIFANQTAQTGDIPFYKIGTLGLEPDCYISRELFQQYKTKYNFPKKGETLITCSGTVGRCLQFDGKDAYFQDSNIVWLHGEKTPISNDFLYWILTKKDWSSLNTTTISRIYTSDLLNLKVTFPANLEEQNKITQLLFKIEERISTQNKIIEGLISQKNSVEEIIFSKKDSWNKDFAENLCSIGTGKSNTQDQCDKGIYPFFIRSDKPVKSSKFLYDCEAVLTIGDGNIGKVFHYVNGKFDLHQRVYKMDNFKNVKGKYFYYYFSKYFYNRALKMSAKGTVDSVRLDMIAKMDIFYPSLNEQIKIINILDTFNEKIDIEKDILAHLMAQKQYLLNSLFI